MKEGNVEAESLIWSDSLVPSAGEADEALQAASFAPRGEALDEGADDEDGSIGPPPRAFLVRGGGVQTSLRLNQSVVPIQLFSSDRDTGSFVGFVCAHDESKGTFYAKLQSEDDNLVQGTSAERSTKGAITTLLDVAEAMQLQEDHDRPRPAARAVRRVDLLPSLPRLPGGADAQVTIAWDSIVAGSRDWVEPGTRTILLRPHLHRHVGVLHLGRGPRQRLPLQWEDLRQRLSPVASREDPCALAACGRRWHSGFPVTALMSRQGRRRGALVWRLWPPTGLPARLGTSSATEAMTPRSDAERPGHLTALPPRGPMQHFNSKCESGDGIVAMDICSFSARKRMVHPASDP
eukprot:CAMPEP_0197901008 /NCGR_PEP_ID=MMETSP1439-20131203/50482_1 /TAXON_ID=66791 /ORGANISM="Gonyaulax spinifera, Strain CCMP409" /LENGTH=348 /DNA_ID=CAMNT_0043521955 /DNA_START=107 /DNA_END=1148 /DNA_ORIENTATION=+